jgi:ArsR family transcriptional regulator, arsenate/arsenite/antimonite-responsive transcriptional repressor
MRDFLAVTNALADPNRVRVLLALRGGELCACQIIELLGLAPSTVSKHLALLKSARLVEARKQGRWMYYRLPGEDDRAPPAAIAALAWAFNSLARDAGARDDRRRLAKILKDDPEDLCRRQARRRGDLTASCASCSCAPETPAAARWPKGGRATSKARRSRPIPRASSRTG